MKQALIAYGMFAFVAFLWFGGMWLAGRHGIWWPWLLLIGVMFAGCAREDLDNDNYSAMTVLSLKKRKKGPTFLKPKPLTPRQKKALRDWGVELSGLLIVKKRK